MIRLQMFKYCYLSFYGGKSTLTLWLAPTNQPIFVHLIKKSKTLCSKLSAQDPLRWVWLCLWFGSIVNYDDSEFLDIPINKPNAI